MSVDYSNCLWFDRVLERSFTAGTGDIVPGGTRPGYQAFGDRFSPGDELAYLMELETGAEWELGRGTFTIDGRISRDAVDVGSNGTSLVNFSAGLKYVRCIVPASLLQRLTAIDPADAILRDGTVDFAADQSLGGHKLTDVATPTDAGDATSKGYVDTGLAGKANSSHNHATGDITNLAEYIRDTIAATLAAGSNVTITVDDGADTITIAATGGGSGDVATDAIWSAKGDLAVATGDDTAIRLPVGSNDQVLVADSTQPSGLKWATPSGGGGGVSGPVSSTDRALALFDGVGGSTITDAPDWAMSASGKLTGKATVFPTVGLTYGGTIDIDLNDGNFHAVTLEGDAVLTVSNAAVGQRFQVSLTQDAVGAWAVTWFPNIAWPGGIVPTQTTFASKTDIFGFECYAINGESQPLFRGFVHGLNYGEPASSYLIFDSFSGTNGTTIDERTAEVGGVDWTVYPDASQDIVIQSGAAEGDGSSASALIDCGETDVTITAEIVLASGSFGAGVILAGTDINNAYFVIVNDSADQLIMYSRSSGSYSALLFTSISTTSGTLTVTKSGTTITATFGDGTLEYEFASEHSGTLVGIRLGNGDRIDTFAVVEVV